MAVVLERSCDETVATAVCGGFGCYARAEFSVEISSPGLRRRKSDFWATVVRGITR